MAPRTSGIPARRRILLVPAVGALTALVALTSLTAACGSSGGGAALSVPTTDQAAPGSPTTPATSSTRTTTPAHAGTADNWTGYHGGGAGAGVGPPSGLWPPRHAWTSPTLDGQLYGEPLVADGLVVVATENDTVYALSAHDGHIKWMTHLGTPVDAGRLACGDIRPVVGITSTPVIDLARHRVFVVAFEQPSESGPVAHHLVGLDLTTGARELDTVIDPAGGDPITNLQRAGLALDDGDVIIGLGGNYGDCGDYHGWVVAAPEAGGSSAGAGGAIKAFEVDPPPDRQGAVWMGGAAPAVDSHGDIWVATGNGSVTSTSQPFDDGDAVLELSPTLELEQYFAPSTYPSDNASDADLGSTAPALVGGNGANGAGLVFQAGKFGASYLLRRDHLGGIGGQLEGVHLCPGGDDADGGDAVVGSVVYVPCADGVKAVALTASPATVTLRWTTPTGSPGPPIVAGGVIWTIDQSVGALYALDPTDGGGVWRAGIGDVDHFPTPSAADGLVLAAATDDVVAFSGPSGPPAVR